MVSFYKDPIKLINMKKVSQILKDIYLINWSNLNILECGAHINGEETSEFELTNNCWYIEANKPDFDLLKTFRKNVLNIALSDQTGVLKFTISSHPGNSSCEYSKEHLDELKRYNSDFKEIEVSSISYIDLLKDLNLTFDVLVLDIEGHEKTVLNSWKTIDKKLLPSILVIECGYDWEERMYTLKELGYKIDCYYFNNCYLSTPNIKTNPELTSAYNNQWKTFIWDNKLIYTNDLI